MLERAVWSGVEEGESKGPFMRVYTIGIWIEEEDAGL